MSKKINILILDDDEYVRYTVQEIFSKDININAYTASCEEEADQILFGDNAKRIDISLVDIWLQDDMEAGLKYAKKMRQDPQTQDIKIIVLSDYENFLNLQKAIEVESSAFVKKKYENIHSLEKEAFSNAAELIDYIYNIHRKDFLRNEKILHLASGWDYDTEEKILYKDCRSEKLAPKMAQILDILANEEIKIKKLGCEQTREVKKPKELHEKLDPNGNITATYKAIDDFKKIMESLTGHHPFIHSKSLQLAVATNQYKRYTPTQEESSKKSRRKINGKEKT